MKHTITRNVDSFYINSAAKFAGIGLNVMEMKKQHVRDT